jgi:hypothetical protein
MCLFVFFPICPPLLHDDFFGSLFFFLFFFFLSLFYYCKLANTKLHTDQGKKQHQVKQWEDEKEMETILPQK